MFAAWYLGVGEVLNHGLAEFPQAKATFKEEFPIVVDTFKDGLPGMSDRSEAKQVQEFAEPDAEEQNPVKRAVNFISRNTRRGLNATSRNARRGLTSVALGSTAFVATSSVDGDTTRETTKLNATVTTDGAIAVAAVIAVVGQSLNEMPKHGYAETAMYLNDVVQDTRFWYAAAAISIASEFVGNRLNKRKMLKVASKAAILEETPESNLQ